MIKSQPFTQGNPFILNGVFQETKAPIRSLPYEYRMRAKAMACFQRMFLIMTANELFSYISRVFLLKEFR